MRGDETPGWHIQRGLAEGLPPLEAAESVAGLLLMRQRMLVRTLETIHAARPGGLSVHGEQLLESAITMAEGMGQIIEALLSDNNG